MNGIAFLLALGAMTATMIGAFELDADPLDAAAGKALFDRNWIPAPASTNASDGLGPLFTARSCATCHARGRGARLVTSEAGRADLVGAVVRFGRADGSTDPYYGLELQTNAVPGLVPEGSAHFLPKLDYRLNGPKLDDGVKAAARVAPSLVDRAVLGLVADEEIVKRADLNKQRSDGVRGRPNFMADGIGRYGWKAGQATLEDQVAHAFAFDIGLSSPRQPHPYGDCTTLEKDCLAAPNGESPAFEGREISSTMVSLVASYLATLRSRADASGPGAQVFESAGCSACHVPKLETRDGGNIPAFTDLLLHDMGTVLDDGVGEPGVKSSEWRTAPLIRGAIGDAPQRYLHDGSAATVAEAIGKHGGEAENSRRLFDALKAEDKQHLIDYVSGL